MTVISSRIRKSAGAPTPRPAKVAGGGGPVPPSATVASAGSVATAPARPAVAVAVADAQSGLVALLRVEAEARAATSERDLAYLIANETRKLVRSRQVFVLAGDPGALRVTAVSSLAAVDRTAPLIGWIEAMAGAALATAETADAVTLDSQSEQSGANGGPGAAYPFRALIALPLRHRSGALLGAIVMARETGWTEQDLVIGKRLAGAYAHAWSALAAPRLPRPWQRWSRRHMAATAAVLAALALVPVPLTALAPAEIVARGALVVATPIDGVIETVSVEPNQAVKVGDVLLRLADTTLKNRLEIAEREVTVADARLKQSTQMAFSDARGLHELGIARAELALKMAERNYARDMLEQSAVRATRSGIAVFADKRELTGKPVAVGERIMEIADPSSVELKIELPVADAIALKPGARVVAFLDSDPLRPFAGTVVRSDYKARPGEGDVAAFRVIASLEAAGRTPPRLGVRGTAQISGDDVPLGFFLFRRPIAAARQWTGL